MQEAPGTLDQVVESTGLFSCRPAPRLSFAKIPTCWKRSTSPAEHLNLVMIVAAGLLVAGMGSLALIARGLRKAPEGYEDEHGFHIVRKKAVNRVLPGSMTTKIRASRGSRRGQSQYQRGRAATSDTPRGFGCVLAKATEVHRALKDNFSRIPLSLRSYFGTPIL